jgi:hypothetical protein
MEITNNISVNGPGFRLSQSSTDRKFDSLQLRLGTNKRLMSPKEGSQGLTTSLKGRFDTENLETIHARFNSVARTIRGADENMGKIENYIDRMKAELQRIVKSYPPFPPGNEERVKRLKSINAFRRLIDQLTIPPPSEEFAVKITLDHGFVFKTDDTQKIPGQKNHHQTGSERLDIPQLPEHADDEKIYAFVDKLDAASELLRQNRSDLAKYAVKIGESYEREVEGVEIFRGYGEEIESADREPEAEIRSGDLSYTLTIEPGLSLTEAQSQLLSLLN